MRLLQVMLLFYNLYKECRDEKEDREKLALDPRSSYSWLAKVNDRTFKLLLSVSVLLSLLRKISFKRFQFEEKMYLFNLKDNSQ
jgi:hypothetical protein